MSTQKDEGPSGNQNSALMQLALRCIIMRRVCVCDPGISLDLFFLKVVAFNISTPWELYIVSLPELEISLHTQMYNYFY